MAKDRRLEKKHSKWRSSSDQSVKSSNLNHASIVADPNRDKERTTDVSSIGETQSSDSRQQSSDLRTRELKRFINDYKKMNRPSSLMHNESFRFYYAPLICGAAVSVVNCIIHIASLRSAGKSWGVSMAGQWVTLAVGPFLVMYAILKLLPAPTESERRNDWLWTRGRLSYGVYALGWALFPIAVLIDRNHYDISSLGLAFAISTGVGGAGFVFSLFAIMSKPSRIISRLWTEVGSFCAVAQASSGVAVTFFLLKPGMGKNSSLLFSITALSLPMLTVWIYLKAPWKKPISASNIAQKVAFAIMHPRVLLYGLSSEVRSIDASIRALRIIDEYDKKKDYLMLKAIAEEITRRYSSERPSRWRLLIGFVVTSLIVVVSATVGALWESIAQELFLAQVKQAACQWLRLLCPAARP